MKDDDFIIMAIDHTSDDPRPVELGEYIRREIRLFLLPPVDVNEILPAIFRGWLLPAWMFYTDECKDCSCKIANPGGAMSAGENWGLTMNAVRITYLICDLIQTLVLLALAVASPIWITPGYYWWTAFAIVILLLGSVSFAKRLNSWEGMGSV